MHTPCFKKYFFYNENKNKIIVQVLENTEEVKKNPLIVLPSSDNQY